FGQRTAGAAAVGHWPLPWHRRPGDLRAGAAVAPYRDPNAVASSAAGKRRSRPARRQSPRAAQRTGAGGRDPALHRRTARRAGSADRRGHHRQCAALVRLEAPAVLTLACTRPSRLAMFYFINEISADEMAKLTTCIGL